MSLDNTTSSAVIIANTKQWIEEIVIGMNFCPFAKRVWDKDLIAYKIADNKTIEEDIFTLLDLCTELDNNNALETGFVIYPKHLANFDDYLDFLELASQLLIEQGYEGIYQLASFHPQYCFDETSQSAAENYTNRSPYPMLHLLKEQSLETALEHYKDADEIPLRNIEAAKQKGAEFFADILKKILND